MELSTHYKSSLIIAIDFDGTIVEDRYPDIGKPRRFAFETMEALQAAGHRLILWTYREGEKLDEAIRFCKKRGIEFYAINKSHPEERIPFKTRKILADVYIDDRNFNGIPEWGIIGQSLLGDFNTRSIKKRSKIRKLFGL